MVILDVLALAGLYALRVMAGAAAFEMPPSAWLIAFCVFLFFSLAMIKRYAELVAMRTIDGAPRPRPRLCARGQRAARGARRRQRLSLGARARALHQRAMRQARSAATS